MLIPLALSLVLGLGVYLVYDGLTDPQPVSSSGKVAWLAGGYERLRAFLLQAGLPQVSPLQFGLVCCGSAIVLALLAQVFLGWPVVTLLAFPGGVGLPVWYFGRRRQQRREAMQRALADAIDELKNSILVGLSVSEALVSLSRIGPEALRPAFELLTRELRLRGLDAALSSTRERLADPVFDIVAMALSVNDQVGGRNVSTVLSSLTVTIRRQVALQAEIRAYQAQSLASARLVALMPLILLVAIRQINPGYLAVFQTLAGQAVIAGCLLSLGLGYLGIRQATRLPEERRVLG